MSINSVIPKCVDGPSFNLTATVSGGIWSGTGITNDTNGTFDPATAGIGNHVITYTTGGSCPGVATTTVTVVAVPTISATANVTTICEGSNVQLGVYTTAGATFYSWSGPGISNPFSSNPTATPTVTSVYTVTVMNSVGCTTSDSITIVVTPAPNVVINSAGPYCELDSAINLSANFSGGVWAGSGITNTSTGTFDPATAGVGTHTITYTVVASATCPIVVITATIEVLPASCCGSGIWPKHFHALDFFGAFPTDVTSDNVGNVYVTGWFDDTVDFESTVLSPIHDRDVFVAKFSSCGLEWIKQFGVTTAGVGGSNAGYGIVM